MPDYLTEHGATRNTSQREQADRDQIVNDAGGFVFELDPAARLRRFLILGSEGGNYYATERTATIKNLGVVRDMIRDNGPAVVEEVIQVSTSGAAPKNDQALYVLAACIAHGDAATKSHAAEALPFVARTATHLFQFVAYAKAMRGGGRVFRWAINKWYAQPVDKLAYQAVKYRQRDGMTHRDVMRLTHPRPVSVEHRDVFAFMSGNVAHEQTWEATDRGERVSRNVEKWRGVSEVTPRVIEGYLRAAASENAELTARLIVDYNLPREAIKPEHLTSAAVWRSLLDAGGGMPLTAMTRNLANMTRYGILEGGYLTKVVDTLTDPEAIRSSRLHPMSILIALRTYAAGHGHRGTNTWTPIPLVIDALDEAFYLAFDNVEPTGKKILLGVDCSGSMSSAVSGVDAQLSAREAAFAMALVTIHAEPNAVAIGFTTRVLELGLSRRQRLDDVVARAPHLGEGTDCSLPVQYAHGVLDAHGPAFDAVVFYTDNQTWAGDRHVHQAARDYRDRAGLPTRYVACGLVANEFTVLDPKDPGSMNVAGFDTAAPALISEFVAGRL